MAPKLFMDEASAAVRGVLLLTKAIHFELEVQLIDMASGEHLTPQYIRMNPQHTIPTLDDDGFIVWDSHAINAYLINKYAEGNDLYPTDPKKRAVIDQRLHFDSGVLFPRFVAVWEPILKEGAKIIPREKSHLLTAAYTMLETFLENSPYVAGNSLSIADFSIVATLTTANVLVPVAENRFPSISKWLEKMKNLPYYHDGNRVGLERFTSIVKNRLA